MSIFRCCVGVVVAATLAGCQATWPQAVPQSVVLAGPVAVPVDVVSYLPIVEVTVNGVGPLRFLLDTGSPTAVVGRELAQRLNLPAGAVAGPQFARSARGDVVAVDYRRIDSLKLGAAEFLHLDAKVLALPSVYRSPGLRIDGLLGLRLFHDLLLRLDYRGRTLTLDPAASLDADNAHVVAVQLQDGKHLLVDATIGVRRVSLLLDTGTSMGLLLLPQDAAGLPYAQGPIPAGGTATAAGSVALLVGRLRDPLRLGTITIRTLRAYTPTPDGAGLTVISPHDADPLFSPTRSLLGGEVLKDYVVSIDQRNRLVALE